MILIAPWGDPSKWKETDYIFENTKKRSRTSLKPLKDAFDPEKILIIAMDSLAMDGSNYEEVKESAESRVRSCVEEFDIGDGDVDVIIAPGKGRFTDFVFDGDMMDCYRYLLAALSEYITDNMDQDIALDVTHGINFETVFAYRAVRDILSVMSFFTEMKFRVYNSDPFVLGTELQINEIENVSVRPVLPSVGADDSVLLRGRKLTDTEHVELRKKQKVLPPKELSAFIGSFYNALPLALFTFAQEAEEIRSSLDCALQLYSEYTDVEKDRVVRRVKLSENFYPYTMAYILASLGRIERKREVSLEELKEISEMFRRDERFKVRIENEIKEISERCHNIPEWELYNRIFSQSKCVKIGGPDKRNFLAHSGFERNAFEVKSNECVKLRYHDSTLKTVMTYSASGLTVAEKTEGSL